MSQDSRVHRPRRGVGELWNAHDGNRLTWAFRAYEHFIDSLSDEIREHLVRKDHQEQAYVVVFGKTQVGKTTLLMELMGVSADAMERVSRVLRGGRPHGNSATATTMEYRHSDDLRWGLRVQEEMCWLDDDEAMTTALGALRDRMERNELVVDSPCVVSIPQDCFLQQASKGASVRMLDLPGDQPANEIEQKHVQEMARRYVPLADLILLVGRGDDLSFLQQSGLTLPGIVDWQCVPERFRIVTTYSFTPQSLRDLVRQSDTAADPQKYRARLIEQIERFGPLSNAARRPQLYFPLEFGKSWLACKDNERDLFDRIAPMISELKQKLQEDIQASTTPLARLRSAMQAHVVIARVKENRLKEVLDKISAMREELGKEQDEAKQIRDMTCKLKKQIEELSGRLAPLNSKSLRKFLDKNFSLIGSTTPEDEGAHESVKGFSTLIRQAERSLRDRLMQSRPMAGSSSTENWFWNGLETVFDSQADNRLKKILSSAFDDFQAHLSEYVWDTYWFTGDGSDYQADKRRLRSCIAEAEKLLVEEGRQRWHEIAIRHLNSQNSSLGSLRAKFLRLQDGGSHIDKRIQSMKVVLQCQERDRREFEEKMAADLKESKRFIKLLNTEYAEELKSRRKRIRGQPVGILAFSELLSAVQLGWVREKLLLEMEPAGS